MRIRYERHNFRRASLAKIHKANEILNSFAEQGYSMTLRQLYYQFVARDLIPNNMSEYNKLKALISKARLAGLVDWQHLEDRTRNVNRHAHWDTPSDLAKTCAEEFRYDLWKDQNYRPEVWIEKDALIGMIERVCQQWDVPYFACKGYNSQSEQWRAGQRFRRYAKEGQTPVVLHLGDHDPSGLDMTRDNRKRLDLFAGTAVEVRRLALNIDQIEQYQPPANPAKESDARITDYAAEFGYQCWELDALTAVYPTLLEELIETEIRDLVDVEQFETDEASQDDQRAHFQAIADRWHDVVDFLEA